MTKLEILQRIVTNHNRISQVMVSGEGAVLVGDTIKDLRLLAQEIQTDVNAEDPGESETAPK